MRKDEIRSDALKYLGAVSLVALIATGCAGPSEDNSWYRSGSISQHEFGTKPTLAPIKVKSGPSVSFSVPEGVIDQGVDVFLCHVMYKCGRCEDYLSDEQRAAIPSAVQFYRRAGETGLANRLDSRLIALVAMPSTPPYKWPTSEKLALLQHIAFDSLVLRIVVGAENKRYIVLLNKASFAARCGN